MNNRKMKAIHGKCLRKMKREDMANTRKWLGKRYQKGCIEKVISSAEEQVLKTNYVKFQIDESNESPLCRRCGSKNKTYGD